MVVVVNYPFRYPAERYEMNDTAEMVGGGGGGTVEQLFWLLLCFFGFH